ncbi:hypothetical protein [Leptolyngbya sp. PCC 6406]|uniref:hypothetical protein n=1 Tax=Leptolyngbya sp. PCC 6406 TaxID=1173264 RepID=UPI0002ACD53E|nr:hypothetical protein [Leptolyngbya sp. PCC 6406]
MSYTFEIVGISPLWNFFTHQQRVESTPHRSRAYLGSHHCTLDSFIAATDLIHEKPDWDWDAVVNDIVSFWVSHGEAINHWRAEFQRADEDSLIVGRVANFTTLREELETLFQE